MRGHQCLVNSRRALPRVLSKGEAQPTLRQLPPWLQQRSQSPATTSCPSRIRYLSTSTARCRKMDELDQKAREFEKEEFVDRRWTTEASLEKSGRDRWPWDYEITDPQIMVYDNGAIEGPLDTAFVLTKIASHESLRMVTPYEPADSKTGAKHKFPLCKIVEKDAEFKKKREVEAQKKEQKARDKGGKVKEFDISWTSTDHDTATKLKRISDVLTKGFGVMVTLSMRKKGKKRDLSDIDCAHVLKTVKEGIEAAGGREKKQQDGEVGDIVKLFYEPGSKKSRPATATEEGKQAQEKQ